MFLRLRAGTYFGQYEAGFSKRGQWVSAEAHYLRPALWDLPEDQAKRLQRFLLRQGTMCAVVSAPDFGTHCRIVAKGRNRGLERTLWMTLQGMEERN